MAEQQLIFGINAVASRLRQGHGVHRLFIRPGRRNARHRELIAAAVAAGVPVTARDIEYEGAHQGVALQVDPIRPLDERLLMAMVEQREKPLLLVLDGVTDPANLGACARSAAAMGVDGIMVPKAGSAPLNQAAIKAASGGLDTVPVYSVTNLSRAMEKLKKRGIWFVGTMPRAQDPVTGVDLTGPLGLVMGAEGKGLRRNTGENCDLLVQIPLTDKSLSLNVSVATGICLFEASRQRRACGKQAGVLRDCPPSP